ncbi:MAG: ATP-dependent Clp protease ATP-binding subunit [Bryobacteraceae bacterium]|nr:ATP-dependent Clp protease ATP-binding subunit [Bryobacteraceae bacterium]
MYEAGLGPDGRPAGVFLLLGPTGTGKTRTVEALAEVLHGSRKNLLRIDCGEYQMDHEVAKLTGAPPGYLGHKETPPVLTQARLSAITSQNSSMSIVLFDEIEKASPSLTRLLLGILDKASLRLGDNAVVNFERTMIFLTSNVGSQKMQQELTPGLGFLKPVPSALNSASRLETMALRAARRAFAPEFMNRLDAAIAYQPLSTEVLASILDLQLREFQQHLNTRLGTRSFLVEYTPRLRAFLLSQGTSIEYGAREIRRSVQRYVAQRVAIMVLEGRTRAGGTLKLDLAHAEGDRLAA